MNLQRIVRLTSTGVFRDGPLHVSAWAQNPTTTPLPKGISDGEMEQWLAHPLDLTNPSTLRGIPTPPPGSNLRTAAEWEEIEVLTITWEGFPCILKQITAASVEECRVVIFSENVSQTTSYLTGNSCGGPMAMDSVEVVDADSNSIWIRDYGANTVYTEYNDGRVLVDWLYNRPRPDDDAIPDVLAAHMGIPSTAPLKAPNDLMNTGGNWMSDGFGTAFASELIFEENGGPAVNWGQQWGLPRPHRSRNRQRGPSVPRCGHLRQDGRASLRRHSPHRHAHEVAGRVHPARGRVPHRCGRRTPNRGQPPVRPQQLHHEVGHAVHVVRIPSPPQYLAVATPTKTATI